DDGRNTRQNLDDGLDHVARFGTRILREVDSRHQTNGQRYEHGDDGNHQRAPKERQETVLAGARTHGGKARVPYRAEEEVDGTDEAEEPDRLGEKRSHNADGGQDRHDRAGDQQIAYNALHLVAGTKTRG